MYHDYFFAIECPSRCIIMYFKCWEMLFWIDRLIFLKEVVAIVNVFMYWRRHSFEFWECCVIFFFVCLFLCLFMFNVTTHRALDIYFWPTSETRGHIFQKISRRTSSYAPIAMRCREDRINRFGRAAERGTETGKARRYATLAEGLAAKQTYRTSWRRGVQPHLTMDVTRLRSAFLSVDDHTKKKYFAKL